MWAIRTPERVRWSLGREPGHPSGDTCPDKSGRIAPVRQAARPYGGNSRSNRQRSGEITFAREPTEGLARVARGSDRSVDRALSATPALSANRRACARHRCVIDSSRQNCNRMPFPRRNNVRPDRGKPFFASARSRQVAQTRLAARSCGHVAQRRGGLLLALRAAQTDGRRAPRLLSVPPLLVAPVGGLDQLSRWKPVRRCVRLRLRRRRE